MIRIAFCSKTGQYVDASVASCPHLVIYGMGPEGYGPLDEFCFAEAEQGENERVACLLKALCGCSFLCCSEIKGQVAARLVRNSIYPLKVGANMTIPEACSHLQRLLHSNPPPWLVLK